MARADTFFDPAKLPEVIFVDDQAIAGPFCKNCGFAMTFHRRLTVPKDRTWRRRNRYPVTDEETLLACPPPNGVNPMDPRCPACTFERMEMKDRAKRVQHKMSCAKWNPPWRSPWHP